ILSFLGSAFILREAPASGGAREPGKKGQRATTGCGGGSALGGKVNKVVILSFAKNLRSFAKLRMTILSFLGSAFILREAPASGGGSRAEPGNQGKCSNGGWSFHSPGGSSLWWRVGSG
ncbi:MAG: hypothetical protein SAL07_17570, partial [Oscillatoria sp. PMC 1051.18]|nr:hypothetical protein [Oscillatoria sp. PMC 1051.18]